MDNLSKLSEYAEDDALDAVAAWVDLGGIRQRLIAFLAPDMARRMWDAQESESLYQASKDAELDEVDYPGHSAVRQPGADEIPWPDEPVPF